MNDAILQRLAAVELSSVWTFPTPLEHRADMSRHLGVELFMKREDRVDDLGSGSKARKLCALLPEALQGGVTVLVTVGSLVSNQCKAVALAAARSGLRAHVVYGGDVQAKPANLRGNYLLTALLEPRITWFERRPWNEMDQALNEVVACELQRGERPYAIAAGINNLAGLVGSIHLGLELAAQLPPSSVTGTDIIAPAGSGTTCFGLKLAAELLGLDWRIYGVCIGEPQAALVSRCLTMRREFGARFGEPHGGAGRLQFIDGLCSRGYDVPDARELAIVRQVAQRFGVLIDTTYMAKAYSGMEQLLRERTLGSGRRLVLVHTGGQFGLLGANPVVDQLCRLHYADWLSQ